MFKGEFTRPIIGRLFPASVAAKLGISSVNITPGSDAWPVATAGAVAGWAVTEGGSIGDSTAFTTAEAALSPGPAPTQDWKSHSTTPDLSGVAPAASLDAARGAVCGVYGVLPSLLDSATTGPLVREAQRHLAQWGLAPVAAIMAQEASEKLGGGVTIDVMRPLQVFDAGGRARAMGQIVEAMAMAKEAGVDLDKAAQIVNFAPEGGTM